MWAGLRLRGGQQLFAGSELAVGSPLLDLGPCIIEKAVFTHQQPGRVPTWAAHYVARSPLPKAGRGWQTFFGIHLTDPLDISCNDPLLYEGKLSVRVRVMRPAS